MVVVRRAWNGCETQFSPSHALEAAGNMDRAIDSTSSEQTVWAVCMGENPVSLNHERRRDLCILYADCYGSWVHESVGNALHETLLNRLTPVHHGSCVLVGWSG